MTHETSFVVLGEPVAQPRHRVGAGKGGGTPRAYLPKNHPVHGYKQACRLVAALSFNRPIPAGEPVELLLTFVLARPKRLIWKKRPMPRLLAPVKPDFDNLAKALTDAIKGEVYADDAQLVRVSVEKWYAAGGESPRTLVTVRRL